jgi:hypothetical protein
MVPEKCFYCKKSATKERMYVIPFDEGSAIFHISCFAKENPDMSEDVKIFLKNRLDKKEEK